jgi:TonB-linked SusC/RagA family outer membrane protein
MKKLFLKLFLFITPFIASAQNISVSLENPTLKEVISVIESQTNLKFAYGNEIDLQSVMPGTYNFNNGNITSVLQEFSAQSNFNFNLVGNNITISGDGPAQEQITVKGMVVDEEGLPLPGATVVEQGTENGVVTDSDGYFRMIANSNSDLIVNFIGYTPQSFSATTEEVTIKLIADSDILEEVVVIGYGTQRKQDVTGSVASISADRIGDLPVPNFEQALKGQAAGVQVIQNTGSPSSGTTIRIRGSGSITAGNDPLYVVDGFPISGGSGGQGGIPGGGNPLNTINLNDIESIDILKDASATAIYGSRGANGVVIITTKSGKVGKSTLSFDAYTSWQSPTKKLDVLSPQEFAEYHIESRENGWLRSGGDPNTPNENRGRFRVPEMYLNPSQWQETDWQDEVLRTGIIRNYNLSANGGTENLKYNISGGYLKNEGIIIGSSMERFSFRTNLNSEINDRLRAGLRFNTSYVVNDQVPTEGHFRGAIVGMALRLTPLIGPYQEDGTYTNPLAMRNNRTGIGTLGAVDNPVAVALEDQYDLDQGRVLGNSFLEYDILKNLTFRTSLGIDFKLNRVHVFQSSLTGRSGSPPPNPQVGHASSSQGINWLSENVLSYNTTIEEDHRIEAIAGYSAQKNDYRFIRVDGREYPSDKVPYVSAAGVVESGTENRNQWALISYYSRVNYSFRNKYLVTATIRQDGSSRFGVKNKYGTFPSAALGWKMSEEDFMDNLDIINNLKWRLSYGISGNDQIPQYQHVPNIVNLGYVLGRNQSIVNAVAPGRLSNPFVTWETSRSWNLGLDLSLLERRINFTADAYKSNTYGLLLNVNIPAVAGFTNTLENIGEVENKGLEFTLTTRNTTGELRWNSSLNYSMNRNKVLELGGSAGDFIDAGNSRTVVGQPMALWYTRVTDGIFNTEEEILNHVPQDNNPRPGDRRFVDVNGDNRVDNADRDFVGNPNPDFTFGITNNFYYKGFTLDILMNGSYGNDIYYKYATGANMNGNLNQDAVVKGRWQSPENPGAGNIPQVVYGFSTLADRDSDFYIHDGSFLRVANVTLAYQLPASIVDNLNIQNARVYVSGQNLLTFTSYPGYDPEIASSGGNPLSFGSDGGIYPLARVFTIGVNLSL